MIILLQQTTTHAIMITGFVFMMMLVIEYLNVLSRGVWQRGLRGGRWRQYLLAAFLGVTPGCLGAFAVVSLYLHKEISLGALLLISILVNHFHFEGWIQDNQLIILLIACLVGLIPESGPHLFFLTLFAEGTIPFSIFLASSIVQDGHGMLPLLAESRQDFLQVKTINFAVGILTGLTGYSVGW